MRFPIDKLAASLLALCLATLCCGSDANAFTVAPAQVVQQTEVRFPATMRALGIKSGHVALVLAVDAQGRLDDAFVLKSSRQAFAKSALKALADWRFSPASSNGAPIASSLRVDIDFELDDALRWQTFQTPLEANVTQAEASEQPITSRSFEELDAIPLPLSLAEPDFDQDGQATIEFYIDELGNVRCPRLTSGRNLAFGKAMLDTVVQWRFEPPRALGQKTNTMVRQTFRFQDGALTSGHPHPSS